MTPAEERAAELKWVRETILGLFAMVAFYGIIASIPWSAVWVWIQALFGGLLSGFTESHPTTLGDIWFLLIVIILIMLSGVRIEIGKGKK